MPGPQTEAVWAWIDVKEANMDFRSGLGAKNLPSNAVDMGLITGWGTKDCYRTTKPGCPNH